MPIIDGAIIWLSPAIIAIIGSSGERRRPAAGGRPERHGQLGEQRAVRVERALRPHALGGQLERDAGGVSSAGDVADVHLDDRASDRS